MGKHSNSVDKMIYQEDIKALYREGANIERIDKEGRTPLIAASMNPDLFFVAKTLIERGANVDAYGSGQYIGAPLHHAAKNGINNTVKLLLSHGANALLLNDDGQTPLDIARAKRHSKVVRTMENHISLFSGWMREFSGVQMLISKKVWVVVVPHGSHNLTSSFELRLSIYSSLQDARPSLILTLKKANMEEPDFNQTDPAVVLTYIPTNARLKLGPAKVGDRQQLEWFCNSCNGIQQAIHPMLLNGIETPAPVVSVSDPPLPQNYEFSVNMNVDDAQPISSIAQSDLSIYYELASKGSSSNWTAVEAGPSIIPTELIQNDNDNNLVASASLALPLPNEYVGTGLIHYPTVESSSINLLIRAGEMLPSGGAGEKKKQKEEKHRVVRSVWKHLSKELVSLADTPGSGWMYEMSE